MRMKTDVLLLLFFVFVMVSCSEDDGLDQNTDPQSEEFIFDFLSDNEGWSGDFADYPEGEETFYELEFSYDSLPAPLDENTGALMLSGNNHSDDLFMFIKKKIEGLSANQEYSVRFAVEIASNVPNSSFGVGGSPGSSVYIKAGATDIEPQKVMEEDNYYRMNIDKNNQAQDGEDMIVLGDFTNGTEEEVYTLKTVENDKDFTIVSNENGEVWIIIGTESGFEATTTIYYNSISVWLDPVE